MACASLTAHSYQETLFLLCASYQICCNFECGGKCLRSSLRVDDNYNFDALPDSQLAVLGVSCRC